MNEESRGRATIRFFSPYKPFLAPGTSADRHDGGLEDIEIARSHYMTVSAAYPVSINVSQTGDDP
jgi:hypothetical protein